MSSTKEYTDEQFQTLRRSEREIDGNEEQSTIDSVVIAEDEVRIELQFDWRDRPEVVTYDLTDDRDVLRLQTLANAHGYDYDQLPYVEGETVTAVYVDGLWTPAPTLPGFDVDDDREPFRERVGRHYGRASRFVRNLSTRQAFIAVLLLKKLLVVGALLMLIF